MGGFCAGVAGDFGVFTSFGPSMSAKVNMAARAATATNRVVTFIVHSCRGSFREMHSACHVSLPTLASKLMARDVNEI